jgi:hypothetical protein
VPDLELKLMHIAPQTRDEMMARTIMKHIEKDNTFASDADNFFIDICTACHSLDLNKIMTLCQGLMVLQHTRFREDE